MKFPHILRDNKETQLPRNFIFVDTETHPNTVDNIQYHYLKLGCACYVNVRDDRDKNTEEWTEFYTVEDYWNWLDKIVREKQKYLMYAHNTHFDFFALDGLNQLKRLGWDLSSWFVKSSVFIMNFTKDKKKLVILDSGNIIKIPLADIAKSMGMKKGEIDFNTASNETLLKYCYQDVKILKEWILRYRSFIKDNDLGNFRYTVAGQAAQSFRHRFMNTSVYIHANQKVYDLERKSYKGGRTEAFFIGEKSKEKFYLVDVNSMYPYVLKKYEYPMRLKNHYTDLDIDYLKFALDRYCVIATVKIKINKPAIAIHDAKTLFPIGEFETTLTTPELKWVLKNGEILDVIEFSCYEKAKLFNKYVDFFYDKKSNYKAQGKDAEYKISKLFLNALYGKFGQQSEKYVVIGNSPDDVNFIEQGFDVDADKPITLFYLMGKIFKMDSIEESCDSFPAIASHVTAYARMYLWTLIERAGEQNCYYCDTDSLLVNKKGLDRLKTLIHPTNLGALDIEKEMDHIVIYGCKDYVMGDKIRIKGIRKNALLISKNTYQQDQFLKFRGILRLGISDSAVVRKVTKHLKRNYDKGIVNSDGRVIPFKFPN